MQIKSSVLPSCLFLISLLFITASSMSAGNHPTTDDWPQFRGPDRDGSAKNTGVFKNIADVQLQVKWLTETGSGYSGVSVAGTVVTTMFSDGTDDFIGAFDSESGKEHWRVRLDSTYPGHDGSLTGPLSSPLIADGRVFGLSPRGLFYALDLTSGKKLWSKDLVKDLGSVKPFYGFSSSPLLSNGNLILETGAKDGKAITAFDPGSGAIIWQAGNDTVSYQSPILMNVHGQQQLIGLGDHTLSGIDAEDGTILWTYRHQGDGSGTGTLSMSPVPSGENRIFLSHRRDASAMIELEKKDDLIVAKEVWTSKYFQNSYDTPVFYDGYLFGFNGRFLTCVDAATGESVWKSRPPGDGFVSLVDGHLVIVTKKGSVAIAKASPEGYNEVASVEVFSGLGWTPLSFAKGRIYGRSQGELACLNINPESAVAEKIQDEESLSGSNSAFRKFLDELKAAPEPDQMLNAFMKKQTSFPITEGENLVHFVYRGTAKDVALIADNLGSRHEEPMTHVPGTDFFFFSTSLEKDAHVKYQFVEDFENRITDPLNHRKTSTVWGEVSQLSMPGWSEAGDLQKATKNTGTIDTAVFVSQLIEGSRRLDVYLPHGYEKGSKRYQVAYVHDGMNAQKLGLMANSLDNIFSKTVEPVIVVFIPQMPNGRGREFLDDLKDAYAEMVASELVAFVDSSYRTIPEVGSRACIGGGFAGYMAFYGTFKQPGVFGKVGGQSLFMLTLEENLMKPLVRTASEQPLQIYNDWGKYDWFAPQEGWSSVEIAQNWDEFLESRGYQPAGGEVNRGFGFAFWRHQTGRMFEALFPIETGEKN